MIKSIKRSWTTKVTAFVLMFAFAISVEAQDLLKGKDLSTVRVDQLSDADIAKLNAQLGSAGMTIEQAEQMALSKGMSISEFNKLKARLSASKSESSANTATGKLKSPDNTKTTTDAKDGSSDSLSVPRYDKTRPRPLIDSAIFGSELYTSVAPSFEPNLKLATPVNYILGPDDVVSVSVYGVQVYDGELPVSPEGSINIPNVGQVKVSGMTIEAATQRIKIAMGRIYPSLNANTSKLSVTLNKIRSIKVNVIGSFFPGTYTVSSLSTVFNVLYLAGGPRQMGSFREIELLRDGSLIRKIDLYRFLVNGNQNDNIGLKDNDVIRIPAYRTRVELQGQVKRPGIFEVLPGESFADILEFASGFTDTAYTASIKVFQRNDRERRVQDLPVSQYREHKPGSGDVYVISRILNRFENRVRITGAVFRPDVYELSPGMKAADLIRKADGLREDAYVIRAQILRLEDDLTRSIISFDPQKALAGNEASNPLLRREDEILVSAVAELRDSLKVSIQGEVRTPGEYEYVVGLTLKDLILQSGGFTDAAFKSVEIARLIHRDSLVITDKRLSSVISVDISASDITFDGFNLPLQPFDLITVRKKGGYVIPQRVMVSGQVLYPGPYAISRSDERVSDLLKRAGGYAPDANPDGAYLKRPITEDERRKKETARKIQRTILAKDTSTLNAMDQEVEQEFQRVPLNLAAIEESPGLIEDLVLKADDELVIPKLDGQVRVNGAVLLNTQVPFNPRNSFKDYISDAGGYSGDAWRRKAYIVYANGRASTAKRFLFFKFYPKVLPGSEIIVPKKADIKGLSAGEIIGLSSALASLAGVVIALLRL